MRRPTDATIRAMLAQGRRLVLGELLGGLAEGMLASGCQVEITFPRPSPGNRCTPIPGPGSRCDASSVRQAPPPAGER